MNATNLERRSIQIPVDEGDGPTQAMQPPRLCPCCALDPLNRDEADAAECVQLYHVGRGGFCDVFAATFRGALVAQKVPRRQSFGRFDNQDGECYEENVHRLMLEGKILKGLNHPNIVRVYTYKCNPPQVVMELHQEGSLHDVMRGDPEIINDKKRLLRWARQIASAMKYWHSRRDLLCHGDLTSANVLISSAGNAIICDAGMAKYKDEAAELVSELSDPVNRNHLRQAPEAILNGTYGEKSDVYTFAFILLEMLTGRDPFVIPHPGCIIGLQQQIARERMQPPIPENLSELPGWKPELLDCVNLVKRCWCVYLDERPTFAEIEAELTHIMAALDRPVEEIQDNKNTLTFLLVAIASVVLEPLLSSLLWARESHSVPGDGRERELGELLKYSYFVPVMTLATMMVLFVFHCIKAAEGGGNGQDSFSERIERLRNRLGIWMNGFTQLSWRRSASDEIIPDSPFQANCPPALQNSIPESSQHAISEIPAPDVQEWSMLRQGLLHDIGHQPETSLHEEIRRFCRRFDQSAPDTEQWSELLEMFAVSPTANALPTWARFEAHVQGFVAREHGQS